ncbi:MAG: hypothetical protein WCL32_05815 [Planctomycetota bacterium]
MKHKSLLAVFALITVCLPFLGAQVADEPKTPDPKVEKAKGPMLPSEDAVKAGFTWRGRIAEVRSVDNSREIRITPIDLQKEQEFKLWDLKERQSIAPNSKKERIEKYRQDWQKKIVDVFPGEPKSILVTDMVRVRTNFVPPVYDEAGLPKKLAPAELSKLKSLRLPGYASDVSNLRTGQLVVVTEPKRAPAPKVVTPTKKDFIGVDPNLNSGNTVRVEALMIFVTHDN